MTFIGRLIVSCLFVPLERILGQTILLAMLAKVFYETREDGLEVLESGRHAGVEMDIK